MNAFSALHCTETLNTAKNLSIWLSIIWLFVWRFPFIWMIWIFHIHAAIDFCQSYFLRGLTPQRCSIITQQRWQFVHRFLFKTVCGTSSWNYSRNVIWLMIVDSWEYHSGNTNIELKRKKYRYLKSHSCVHDRYTFIACWSENKYLILS